MKKFLLILFALFAFMSPVLHSNDIFAEEQTSAKAIAVVEQNSKRLLYSKNCDLELAMASTTKIVTAITVLENCSSLDEPFEIDDRAVGVPGTSIYLRKGETLTVRELLYGLMLVSGNDAATALAYRVGGDISHFCELMEETAKKAGAQNSSFKNPHGLDEEGHYTTALDLALITVYAFKNSTFSEIVSTTNIAISGNDEVEKRYLKNKNKLLTTYEGCTGVKTGFTDDAGRCFVGSSSRGNMSVVCVVFNCGPMFEECARLMDKAYAEYNMVEVVPPYNYIRNLPVIEGSSDSVKIYTVKGLTMPLTTEEYLLLSYEYDLPNAAEAPIEKEEVLGKLRVYIKDNLIYEENILAMEDVSSLDIIDNLKEIIKYW